MADGRPVRIGVVGLGLIAQAVHLQNLHTLREQLPVTYVCDLSATLAAQVAAEWGVPCHTADIDDVLASPDVDAVLLLTPGTHAELAYRALRAGKHVLAEKPLAHTVRECRELAALAGEAGLVLQVGYMKMYDPAVTRARAELPGVGVPRLVRVTVLHPADEPQAAHQRQVRHRDGDPGAAAAAVAYERARLDEALGAIGDPYRALYDEVLNGSVCHQLSLLRSVFGEAPLRWSYAQLGTSTAGARLEEPPQLQAVGTLGESQLVLSWNWLPDYPEYEEELAVFGSAGRLRLALPGPYLRDHRAELVVERLDGDDRAATRFRADHGTGFTRELQAFHLAVASGGPVLSTAAGAAYDTDALQRLVHVLAGDGS
ncbi:MAG: gfo/Idh/MocA family oxidoreductase [Streptosporangiales bacterium]|nr:gfo/Idh/MocA family oxidoreductase [Streptosporangiales bacterium]